MAFSIKQFIQKVPGSLGRYNLRRLFESVLTDLTAVRAPLAGVLQGSATWDPGSLVDGAGESKDVTVTGAALGDFAIASLGVDTVDLLLTATVTAADTVTVRLQNESTATADLASSTLNVVVLPQASFAAPAALTTTA